MKPRKIYFRVVGTILLAGLLAGGCSSTPEKETVSQDVPLSGTDEQIFVGDTIEMNYDPNVIMKRAESFHDKEGYAEAIVEYQHFLDLHGNHVLAPYAQYRLALSHFKMIQTIDRDISPIEKARNEFIELMQKHPASQYEAEARIKIGECEDLLAQHHLFVAEFYYKKEAYLAAAQRYKMIIDSYPHLDAAAEAKYELAKTYNDLGVPDWSRDWLVALVREHPQHKLRNDGLKMLASIQKEHPNLVVAQNLGTLDTNLLTTSFLPLNQSAPIVPSAKNSHQGTTAQHKPSHTECAIGSWCETSGSIDSSSISANHSSTPAPITCQTGTWCE
ncbi:outer membrane protein assembly factor BamD [Candidatus Nitronereus thalassa]|uniref:Outer membrane protein assembly factor BamD n=1 Tax=Candidatus Nitronereus thalassa TaxID=3020898 RepID=A0ABU3K856_9BACT|nr:outer membrane protein assembly factor BamD [Candidatus Nitronereus thalassa]MDT7042570.1 outer membrane protein assembly factor BamD [Candidatus Nitronereus thalassa]